MHLSLALPSPIPSDPRETIADRRIRLVVQRFERPLLTFAARILGDAERARDVVQETFIRFARSAPAEFQDDDPARWLFTVCRHRALDVCRREGRVTFVAQEELLDAPAATLAPNEAAARREEGELLLLLVGRLPARQQELVQLKFQQDLSYREMAEVTGLSEGNVGFLLHGAMNRLRALRDEFEAAKRGSKSPDRKL